MWFSAKVRDVAIEHDLIFNETKTMYIHVCVFRIEVLHQ